MFGKPFFSTLPELPALFDDIFIDYDKYFESNKKIYMKDEVIYVELPGIKKENIVLKDLGKRAMLIEWSQDDSKGKYKIKVPSHSDTSAEYADGILKIKFKEDIKRDEIGRD